MTSLRFTPFHSLHKQAGARLVPFAGWEMPVQFAGVMAEHKAVREKAGLFDISHMGQLWVTGPTARESLQGLVTNDVSRLAPNRGLYALLCREDGGVVDDLYVYCFEDERFLVIVNASRMEADLGWMEPRLRPETEIMEQPQPAALALQGPAAETILRKLSRDAVQLARNEVAEFPIDDMELVVARTGYTGEDGFEVFGPAGHVFPFYQNLMKAGEAEGLAPCGLGARDTLRLEMGYRLYGHDMDETHTALEAGLGWVVKFDAGDFIGRDALLKEKAAGSKRRLIGFWLKERGVPREACAIACAGQEIGRVTSGTFSPSLQIGIGLGYVDSALYPKGAEDARPLSIALHGRPVPAEFVTPPFYRKPQLSGEKRS